MMRRAPRRPRSAPRVHVIASLGGHLELLDALRPVLDEYSTTWITSEGARAHHLRDLGQRVLTLPRLDRSRLSARALVSSTGLAVRERPEIVVSSGAGLALPFCAASRTFGAQLIFAETMARVDSPSMTGRQMARLGAKMFVQWPELAAHYPRAQVCRPLLLEGLGEIDPGPGRGTFVTVGSHDQGFARLADLVGDAASRGRLPRPIVVQDGVAEARPQWADVHHRFVSPDAFGELVSASAIVVTHGGAGAIATALARGRRPIVVPRRKAFSEHVDDHQLELVGKLAALGLVIRGDEGIDLATLAAARTAVQPTPALIAHPSLRDEVAVALATAAG
jgi:UDP-N-acetylglucosamine--N-acetylmuramyl-(pentapeptide) pyrophosphoryl-undecaprenol N-acetylglucosamine transferase